MARATKRQIREFQRHGTEIAAEATKAKLTRRQLVKMGLLGAGGAAMMAALPGRIARAAQGSGDIGLSSSATIPVSPKHTPW
jgi:hypothetical protein